MKKEEEDMEKTNLCSPNKTTIKAMEEAREGKGKRYKTVEDMFADVRVKDS